jgi:organic radical activating enzyme
MANPIKIEPEYAVPYKFVEWMITDKCNYDCSFCGTENKAGIRGRLDLETNKKIVDAIAIECSGSPYWIQLTGGEPTLYPDFIELVSYMKEKGAMISLISNGSRSLRWWEELRDSHLLDLLYITFHSQQVADYKHIANVIKLFQKEETVSIILATYVKESVDYVLEGCDYLKANTGSYICINAMSIKSQFMGSLVEDEKYERIKKYTWTTGDLFKSKTKSNLPGAMIRTPRTKIIYDDSTVEIENGTYFMKLGKNKFLNWECDLGLSTMKIEIDKIYRGGCRVGSKKFSIENIKFWDTPVICNKAECFCGTDIFYKKTKL